MKRNKLLLTMGLAAGLGLAAQAQAGFMPAFEGYSVFGTPAAGGLACAQCDSTVSFAVYQNNGQTGNWITDLGLTNSVRDQWPIVNNNPPPTTTGQESYVYYYQVVNTDPQQIPGVPDSPVHDFNATFGPFGTANPFISGGYLDGWVFANASNAVVPDNPPNDGIPDALQQVTPLILGLGINPTGLTDSQTLNNWCTSAAVPGAFDECMLWSFNNIIPAGGTSSVLFLTSNRAPNTYRWGETDSPGGFGSAGDLPSIPEPATLALMGLGLAGLGWTKRRRAA